MKALTRLPGDIRRAMRLVRRSPGFFIAAALIIGLGIGANAAVFQLVDALLLRPLPVADPGTLTTVQLADTTRWSGRRTGAGPVLSNRLWEAVRDSGTFAGALAWANADLRIGHGGERHVVRGLFVSGTFFEALGVRAARGRLLTSQDDRAGCGAGGAIVSDSFWRREFGADPSLVGRPITIGDQVVDVLGITPPGFAGVEVGRGFDVAVPICAHATLGAEKGWLTDGNVWWLTVMGRRHQHQSLERLNATLDLASAPWFEATIPDGSGTAAAANYRNLRLRAVDGAAGVSALRTAFGDPVAFLLLIAGLVLVLVCTSLALLVLSRAAARQPEFAVRIALGASATDVVRQVIVENVLLAACGAAIGLASCGIFSQALIRLLGPDVAIDLQINAPLLAFVALAAAIACVIFGVLPAWLASGAATTATELVASARGATAATGGRRVRQGLVVAQLALSLVLLCGAFVFGGTLRNLLAVDSGFEPADVTVARVDFSRLGAGRGGAPERRAALERVRQVPGVVSAAEVRHVPLSGTGSSVQVQVDGRGGIDRATVRLNGVSDGYFEAMGIRLASGRAFMTTDSAAAPRVAIVNRAFTDRLGITGDPHGLRLRLNNSSIVVEIVGVAPNTKQFTLREEAVPMLFVPMAQMPDPRPYTDFVIRAAAASTIPAAVRRALADVSPDIDVEFRSLAAAIERGLLRERLLAMLSGFFGVLAVVIAVVGVYGVILELVSRRRAEIGLRMALGATRRNILEMLLRQVGGLTGAGLLAGGLLVVAGADSVRSLVFGVQPLDVAALGYACAVLASATGLAALWPACRAAMIEPVVALRGE